MNPMLLYIPLVAGSAMLVALLIIWLKEIRSNLKAVVLLAAGVSVVQFLSGLLFAASHPEVGAVSIFMAMIISFATVRIYNSLRPHWKNAEDAPGKIEKMIKDYNDVLTHTTNIIERERIKNQIAKLNEDRKNSN